MSGIGSPRTVRRSAVVTFFRRIVKEKPLGTVGDLILSAENGPEFTRCVADLLRRSD